MLETPTDSCLSLFQRTSLPRRVRVPASVVSMETVFLVMPRADADSGSARGRSADGPDYISPHLSPEIRTIREQLESRLVCGKPNPDTVDDTDVVERGRRSIRVKRVVGGVPAMPVSFFVFLQNLDEEEPSETSP